MLTFAHSDDSIAKQETDEVPGGVYVYSSNPIFLDLSPPFLAIVGGFQLLPKIEQVLVHFVSDDCAAENGTRLAAATYPAGKPLRRWQNISSSDPEFQKKLAQVHSRLIGALSPPMDWIGKQLQLRGSLVRIDSTAPYAGLLHPKYWMLNPDVEVGMDGTVTTHETQDAGTFSQGATTTTTSTTTTTAASCSFFNDQDACTNAKDGAASYCMWNDNEQFCYHENEPQVEIIVSELEYQGQHQETVDVVIIACCVALLIGTFFLYHVAEFGKQRLKKRYAEAEISYKMGKRGKFKGDTLDNITKHQGFSAFEMPTELISVLFPYRGIFTFSIQRFFRRYYRPVIDPQDGESRSFAHCFSKNGVKDRRQSTHDSTVAGLGLKHVITLQDYEDSGVPFSRFLKQYHLFCFREMMYEETDPLRVRQHLMMNEVDPSATNPNRPNGYSMEVYKLRTVQGVWLNESAVELMEKVAMRSRYDLKAMLMDLLSHSGGEDSAETDGYNEHPSGCCDDLQSSCRSACAQPMHSIGADKPFTFASDLFETAMRNIDSYDVRTNVGTNNNVDNNLWLNFKLGLFFGLCCPKKKARKPQNATNLADAPATAPVFVENNEKNATALIDLACLLLRFEKLLDLNGFGKQEALEMIEAAHLKGISQTAAAFRKDHGGTPNSTNKGLPSFRKHAPMELAKRIRKLLELKVTNLGRAATRRTCLYLSQAPRFHGADHSISMC